MTSERMTVDLAVLLAETRARLTGPGGPFEIVEEVVRGLRLPVFANRPTSLRALLLDSSRHGDTEYLVRGNSRVSFAQHARQVASLATALRDEYGVRAGDRVAVFAGNCPEWVTTFWAVASLGAITVAYNAWWSGREVSYALGHSTPRVVVADSKRVDLLRTADDRSVPVIGIHADFGDLVRAADPALPESDVSEDDPAVVMYTSGTTGYPKGALHSVRNVIAVLEYHLLNDAIAAAMGPTVRPRRFLMSLPLFHIASLHNLAIPRLVSGDTVVIDTGRFDVERVLQLVQSERITNWAVVPTMAHRLVNSDAIERYDVSSLIAMSVNSAPSSVALKDRLRAAIPTIGASLADSYGLTESCTAATVASSADLAVRPDTVGRPIATVQLEIRDADGTAMPDGQEGEICLRSQYNMLGYWNDPAATSAVYASDGWLRTGDIGTMRDGLLFISTRRSDLILRGGENVYPAEVEAVLAEHPAVAECAVFGVEHADLGEEVAATVVVTPAAAITDSELRDYVAQRLAYYKVPSRWQLTSDALARTATGKVIRSELRG
jgi:acyl-CoA synthetase (AMP-forming)/AMP-acid ligase II